MLVTRRRSWGSVGPPSAVRSVTDMVFLLGRGASTPSLGPAGRSEERPGARAEGGEAQIRPVVVC
ncbi:hypothetical protein GCM10009593_10150 [Microlunatus antarcticus]